MDFLFLGDQLLLSEALEINRWTIFKRSEKTCCDSKWKENDKGCSPSLSPHGLDFVSEQTPKWITGLK